MPKYAELIYNGLWFAPEREMLQAAIDKSQEFVTGSVRLKLYKGNVGVVGRESDLFRRCVLWSVGLLLALFVLYTQRAHPLRRDARLAIAGESRVAVTLGEPSAVGPASPPGPRTCRRPRRPDTTSCSRRTGCTRTGR